MSSYLDEDACEQGEICIEPGICQCGDLGGHCGPEELCDDGLCSSDNSCSSPMVMIPSEVFQMGCNQEFDDNCESDEIPLHEVEISAYEIDITEITNEQYAIFLNSTGNTECEFNSEYYECIETDAPELQLEQIEGEWRAKLGKEFYPVVEVTWYGARSYCIWAGKRLCSESEWEKAARGTDGRIYPWGNETATCDRAIMINSENVHGCGERRSWPVGSKPAGIYGLYDMSGNTSEWVEDDYHSRYDNVPGTNEPWIEDNRLDDRVFRNGSWSSPAYVQRSSYRTAYAPINSVNSLTSRCCRGIIP